MSIAIAFAGQKGGSGKSMAARAFAAEMARKRKSVVLIDIDVGQRTCIDWNEARGVNKIKPILHVVAADPDDAADFGIGPYRGEFDYIIIDAPGWSDGLTLSLAEQCGYVVLPSMPTTDDLRPTIRLCHELVDGGIDPARLGILLSRVSTVAERKFATAYLKQVDLKPLPHDLPEQTSYRNAANTGLAATEVKAEGPRNKARDAMAGILAALRSANKNEDARAAAAKAERYDFDADKGDW